jgi:acetyl esterase
MPLDPQFRVVLDTFEAKGLVPLVRGDAATTRAHYQRLALSRRGADYVPEQVASVADQRSPGGVPVRVYEPLRPRGSTLIYLHGGWVLGDVETHDPLCRRVANGTGARVVSVDCRLAPEHPFPAGLDDAEDVLHWLQAADPDRPLGVAGDSAGASLTAGLRDEGSAYAGRLTSAGVPTEYVPGPGLIHGFASFLGVVDAADATVAAILDRLGQLLQA